MSSYKILEQNGVEIENIDGAVMNSVAAQGMDGVVGGVLNECHVATTGQSIIIDTGEVLLSGYRVKITEPMILSVAAPVPDGTVKERRILMSLTVSADRTVSFRVLVSASQSTSGSDIFSTENGMCVLELGRFSFDTNSRIINVCRSAPIIPTKTEHGRCFFTSRDLPTVFKNDVISDLCIFPRDGDSLINQRGNAIYRYHAFSGRGTARVYIYQCVRNGMTQAAHGENIGPIIGNFSGYPFNTPPVTGANRDLSEIGTDNFVNSNNEVFQNTPLSLVASFEMPTPFASSTSIVDYAVSHSLDFPKLRLVDGGLNDFVLVVRFKATAKKSVGTLIIHQVDNGGALIRDGQKFFEYWCADCWLETAIATSFSVTEGDTSEYEMFFFEQGGGEGINMTFNGASFMDTFNIDAEAGGEWVYDGPLSDTSGIRSIDASPDSISTVSGNSSLTYQNLTVNAKPGDIHIKTPSSILTLTTAQIWTCRYSKPAQQKQMWEKIFG
jgi:hypothetical protein